MTVKKIEVSHECAVGCPTCFGSGEGMYDGSRGCQSCRGTGTLWDEGEVTDQFEVEWSKENFDDLEIVDGTNGPQCQYCGQDLLEYIIEELVWELKKDKTHA
jgi:hypothetical protein